jgi:hypothetical protein
VPSRRAGLSMTRTLTPRRLAAITALSRLQRPWCGKRRCDLDQHGDEHDAQPTAIRPNEIKYQA